MPALTSDQEKIRELILEIFPNSQALDEDTLDDIAQGKPVHMEVNRAATHINLIAVAQEAEIYVPLLTVLLEIGLHGYEVWSKSHAKRKPSTADLVDEIIVRLKAQNPQINLNRAVVERAIEASERMAG